MRKPKQRIRAEDKSVIDQILSNNVQDVKPIYIQSNHVNPTPIGCRIFKSYSSFSIIIFVQKNFDC